MKKITLQFFLCLICIPFCLDSQDRFELNGTDRESLSRGELVIRKEKIEGTPWPEVTVFSTIKATALESCAVFYAYHEHREFLPDLLSSVPVRYISPTDLHIKFEMRVPWPLRNSKYITGNRFSKFGNGGFRIDWYHVTSNSSRNTKGSVIFLPYKKGTLFVYRTFIHPKSKLAGLFKKRMLKEVQRSVKAIILRIESVIKSDPGKMPGYINAIKKSLAGEYVYKGIQGAGERSQGSPN